MKYNISFETAKNLLIEKYNKINKEPESKSFFSFLWKPEPKRNIVKEFEYAKSIPELIVIVASAKEANPLKFTVLVNLCGITEEKIITLSRELRKEALSSGAGAYGSPLYTKDEAIDQLFKQQSEAARSKLTNSIELQTFQASASFGND